MLMIDKETIEIAGDAVTIADETFVLINEIYSSVQAKDGKIEEAKNALDKYILMALICARVEGKVMRSPEKAKETSENFKILIEEALKSINLIRDFLNKQ